jgi:DNA mismatch repair protein MutH
MEREEAIEKLSKLIGGQDLHKLADKYKVTVCTAEGKVNKGWAGHVCERYLGLPINSAQSPNFGSWELKCIPIHRLKSGKLSIKETMAITMIDSYNVEKTPFCRSHLLDKLKKLVIVARTVGKHYSEPTFVYSVASVDTDEFYKRIEADYNEVRNCIKDPNRGFEELTGKMGVYIQPRTKGSGHGSTTRAFYARTSFLKLLVDLEE